MLEVLRMLATQVLVCLPIGWVEVLQVLRMLAAQVLVYLSIGLQCWKFCACWPHRYLCACLSVGLKCWKFCGCWLHRYLCTYRLGCSVGSSAHVGHTGTCVPAYRLVLRCWKFWRESVV